MQQTNYISQSVLDEYATKQPDFGPLGEGIFQRTYSRILPHGGKETWWDLCKRVTNGNIAFNPSRLIENEADELFKSLFNFNIIPGGRMIFNTGTPKNLVSNCFTNGPGKSLSEHFSVAFELLLQGAGVFNGPVTA